MRVRTGAVLLLMFAGGVTAAPPPSPLPARLSETGLYVRGSLSVDPRNRPFSPQYALWSDGARKTRWVQLPPGARIDARDVDAWQFPVGTRFWKEFAIDGRRIETRLLWRSSAGAWSFASYVWNDAQTDATLAPESGVPDLIDIAPGKRHSIPSVQDCVACHDNGATPVLGFTALQLSTDRDPLAPHAEPLAAGMLTLRTLVEEEALAPARPGLMISPPRIPGDPITRAALGYLSANCGQCHNERSSLATVRYPLLMPAYATGAQMEAALGALLRRTAKWDIPHHPPGTTRFVTPGAPDASALLARMRSRRPSSQMPPLGTVLPDSAAIELISTWIRHLAP